MISYVRKRLQNFHPHMVRRVEIPKPDGRLRPLGIPTIEDRIFQQCIKQVLEPICEAKFYKHSYGFRPNRSAHHAIARAMFLANQSDFHFVVDVDIKGFFDNVNHGKLLKQLWTLGIQDKQVLRVLSKMLKAPIAGVGIPEKGVPQGGILSPLLANVVLNELDWWISNQWETFQSHKQYYGPSEQYRALRSTSLKKVFIVRYADDFKLFCKTRSEAERIYIAVQKWLMERLGLEISPEKSKIVNLKKQWSDFLGFCIENEYKKHVAKLSKLKVGANVGVINAELESEFGEVPNTYVERLSMLIDILVAGVKDVYLDKKKLIIIIDGVDDVLRFKKNQLYIISSLVRSIDYINDLLYGILPVKIILLIREDILSNFTDPDLNKIKRDEAINISWFDRQDELKELVNLRFLFSGISQDNIATHWNTLFPKNIREKDSWIYILEFTLGKPRDILQFLKCCQELYPEAETLNFSEVSKVLKYYARNYFIEEMKNEITGFISDDFILSLPGILQSLASRSFSFFDFHRVSINQNHTRQPDELESKKMLQLLFDSGYLGQLYKTPNKRGEKTSVIFKYRNPTAHIDYSQKFITHRGIFRGLDVRL